VSRDQEFAFWFRPINSEAASSARRIHTFSSSFRISGPPKSYPYRTSTARYFSPRESRHRTHVNVLRLGQSVMRESFIQDNIAASSSQAVTSSRDAMVEQAVPSSSEWRRRTTSPVSPASSRAAHEHHMSPRVSSRKGKEKASPDEELLDEVAERSDDEEESEQGTDGDELLLVDCES
jgi:hypothetical protein